MELPDPVGSQGSVVGKLDRKTDAGFIRSIDNQLLDDHSGKVRRQALGVKTRSVKSI